MNLPDIGRIVECKTEYYGHFSLKLIMLLNSLSHFKNCNKIHYTLRNSLYIHVLISLPPTGTIEKSHNCFDCFDCVDMSKNVCLDLHRRFFFDFFSPVLRNCIWVVVWLEDAVLPSIVLAIHVLLWCPMFQPQLKSCQMPKLFY